VKIFHKLIVVRPTGPSP